MIAYVVVAVEVMVAKVAHAEVAGLIGLLLAMPALAGFLLARGSPRTRMVWLVLASMFFSWLGDWVGDIIQPHVPVKGVLFLVAHLCSIAAFWPFHSKSITHRH